MSLKINTKESPMPFENRLAHEQREDQANTQDKFAESAAFMAGPDNPSGMSNSDRVELMNYAYGVNGLY